MYKLLSIVWVVLLISSNSVIAEERGLLVFKSEYSASETLARLKANLQEKKFKVFSHIDHSAGAKANAITIRDTQLVVFGNPKIGSRLMQCNQAVAIDLPQKALIWKDSDGSILLAFNNPDYLSQRHQLGNCQQLISKITAALTKIANEVTQKRSKE